MSCVVVPLYPLASPCHVYNRALPDTCNLVSRLVAHISRAFVCFLPLLKFALLLEGPRRQTEPASRHLRLALRSIADTLSFFFSYFNFCPPGLTRATQPRYTSTVQYMAVPVTINRKACGFQVIRILHNNRRQ